MNVSPPATLTLLDLYYLALVSLLISRWYGVETKSMENENEFQGDDQWLYDQQAKEEKVGILGEVEVSFGEEIDESLVEKLDKAIKTDPMDFLGK